MRRRGRPRGPRVVKALFRRRKDEMENQAGAADSLGKGRGDVMLAFWDNQRLAHQGKEQ